MPPSLTFDPSGKSSWELMRDSARRDLERHDDLMAVKRFWMRLVLWGLAGAGFLLYLVGTVSGWAGGVTTGLTVYLTGLAFVGLAIRPEAIRFDRMIRPGIEARLREIEGHVEPGRRGTTPQPSPSRGQRV